MNPHDINTPYNPPSWATGNVSSEDAAFLDTMVRSVSPAGMIEVGVASGCSSAVLLRALASLGGDRRLHSFDLTEKCYFDQSRAVGAAVVEMAPELQGKWSLKTGCRAVDAGRELAGAGINLAFVDADHRQPWPTVDVWALLPALAPDAWVVLHDIVLSQITEWRMFGAENLYNVWPGEKRASEGTGNIGAIRLPGDHAKAREWLRISLKRLWEADVDSKLLDQLGMPREERPDPATAVGLPEGWSLRLTTALMQGRELVIWGAGGGGQACLAMLLQNGIRPTTFVDRDAAKHGKHIQGIPVCPVETLRAKAPPPFVVVASMHAMEILRELTRLGLGAEEDHLCFRMWADTRRLVANSEAETDTEPLLGMTTSEEQQFLLRYARTRHSGAGQIVDLGCWLGSTTIPLARGLNAAGAPADQIVHAYDIFVWREWMERYSKDVNGSFVPGDSFLPEFHRRLGPLSVRVRVRPGDLTRTTWSDGPIEMLVVDSMKSWELCVAITHNFLPALIPGRSLVLHQDFKYWACPWIHLTMYRLRDSFEIAEELEQSTGTVFRLVRPLDLARVPPNLQPTDFTIAEIDEAYAYWASHSTGGLVSLLPYARWLLLVERGAVAEARAGLEALLEDSRDWPDRLLEELRVRVPGIVVPLPWRQSLAGAVAAGRRILMWGAGSGGRELLRGNLELRAVIRGVLDSDPVKVGRVLEGVPIASPADLASETQPRPFVVVATSFTSEVTARLRKLCYRRDADFTLADLS